jgi:hypothetical protein
MVDVPRAGAARSIVLTDCTTEALLRQHVIAVGTRDAVLRPKLIFFGSSDALVFVAVVVRPLVGAGLFYVGLAPTFWARH